VLDKSVLIKAFEKKGVVIAGTKTVDTINADDIKIQEEAPSPSPPPPPAAPPPPPTPPPPPPPQKPEGCSSECSASDLGNNECDDACNSLACQFDSGDCHAIYVTPQLVKLGKSVNTSYVTYQLFVNLTHKNTTVYAMMGSQATSLVVPPAYQVKPPLGVNMGGVGVDYLKLNNESKYDSWLTVGITGGDSGQQINSVGLSWSDWTSDKGIDDNDCGVFWMNPLKANQSASYESNPIMLGQLTVQKGYTGNVTFGLKGKHHGNVDWRQEGLSFSLGSAP